eukprot:jgi/Chlat1/7839/Chrsp66S07285
MAAAAAAGRTTAVSVAATPSSTGCRQPQPRRRDVGVVVTAASAAGRRGVGLPAAPAAADCSRLVARGLGEGCGAAAVCASSTQARRLSTLTVRAHAMDADVAITENEAETGVAGTSQGSQAASTSEGEQLDTDDDKALSVVEVCDRLIALFRSKPRPEWRRLITFSNQWPKIRDKVYKRIDESIAARMQDPAEKTELMQLRKRLHKTEEQLEEHNKLVNEVLATPADQWDVLVANRAKEFNSDFFDHLKNLIDAVADAEERDKLLTIAQRLLSLVEAHEQILKDQMALATAQAKMIEILQAGDMAAAEAKIDEMTDNGQLDSALLLTMAKMYASCKENTPKSEIVEMMGSLYFKAKENLGRNMPDEVRILRHVLSMEDPNERRAALAEAFTPGMQYETATEDFLSSSPERFVGTVESILRAYEQQQNSKLLQEAKGFMNPKAIERIKEVLELVRQDFM